MSLLDEQDIPVVQPVQNRVDLSRSTRLRQMAQKNRSSEPVSEALKETPRSALGRQNEPLSQAVALIQQTAETLLAGFPPGQQKSFFKIKYGFDYDEILKRSIRSSFVKFKLDQRKIQNFDSIAGLNCLGQKVES